MFHGSFWLCAVFLIGIGTAADIPFVLSDNPAMVASYTYAQLEQASLGSPELAGVPSVSSPSDAGGLVLPIVGGGSAPEEQTDMKEADLKKALDARVEPDNSRVRDEAVVLALKYPGEKTIEQIMEYGIQHGRSHTGFGKLGRYDPPEADGGIRPGARGRLPSGSYGGPGFWNVSKYSERKTLRE